MRSSKIDELTEKIRGNLLTAKDIVCKAFTVKNLYADSFDPPYWVSVPFSNRTLTKDFISILTDCGFKYYKTSGGILSLDDKDAQNENPEAPDGWRFRHNNQGWDELELEIRIKGQVAERKRGVVLFPFLKSEYLTPSGHELHRRIIEIIAAHDPLAHSLVVEIFANAGSLIVPFERIDFSGVRSFRTLFREFANGNAEIWRMANSDERPFEFLNYDNSIDEYYILEKFQPEVFDLWASQLMLTP